jgi:hypothetical protein
VQLANVEANAATPAMFTARPSQDAPSSHSGLQSWSCAQLLCAATNASTVEGAQVGSQKHDTAPGVSVPPQCPRLHGSLLKQLHAGAWLVRSHDAGSVTHTNGPFAAQPGAPLASLQPGDGGAVPGGQEPSDALGTQPTPA